jgi:hypothetical protein
VSFDLAHATPGGLAATQNSSEQLATAPSRHAPNLGEIRPGSKCVVRRRAQGSSATDRFRASGRGNPRESIKLYRHARTVIDETRKNHRSGALESSGFPVRRPR